MKAVIFDMDGVLIDSEPHHFRLERAIFEELGISVTEEEHELFVGTSGREMFGLLKKRFGLTRSVEDILEEERRRYFGILKSRQIPVISGLPELVAGLSSAGMHLAVASSAPRNQIDLVLSFSSGEYPSLGPYFPVRVSGDDVKFSKPDPEIFLRAARLMGIPPEECWVIEDSENGIRAGLAAGMKCIGFENHGSGFQDLTRAHHRITKMEDAAETILR